MTQRQREFTSLLAWFFLQHGQPEKAVVLLRGALRLLPDIPELLKALAVAELQRGDAGAALAAAEHYVEAAQDHGPESPIQLVRARALLQLGRAAEGRKAFRRLLDARHAGDVAASSGRP
jgi:tetratricopeptide (TPR) repeat protein